MVRRIMSDPDPQEMQMRKLQTNWWCKRVCSPYQCSDKMSEDWVKIEYWVKIEEYRSLLGQENKMMRIALLLRIVQWYKRMWCTIKLPTWPQGWITMSMVCKVGVAVVLGPSCLACPPFKCSVEVIQTNVVYNQAVYILHHLAAGVGLDGVCSEGKWMVCIWG